MLQQDSESEFWLLSDVHFLSSALHDNSIAFNQFAEGAAGKEMRYQAESLEAFVAEALEKRPTGVILTGERKQVQNLLPSYWHHYKKLRSWY